MRFYWDLFRTYLSQYAKARLAYRWDLLAGLIGDLAFQAASLIFLLVIFAQVPDLAGWSRAETVFIFGYFGLPYALFGTLSNGLWDFTDKYIIRGELDRLLLRPAHSLFQMLLEGVDLEPLSGLLSGTALLLWAGSRLGLGLRWYDPLLLLLLLLGSCAVYAGLYLSLACIAFWTDSRTGIINLVWNLNQYGKYPVTIYNRLWRFVLSWLLPFAFTAAYPAGYFLRRGTWALYALATPLMGAIFLALSLAIWRAGVARYHGAGS